MSASEASDDDPASEAPRAWSRRRFLRQAAAGAAAATAGTLLYTWRVEPHWMEVVERSLPVAGLPPALAGQRVVQLSDLHVGPIVDPDFLRAAMARVAALAPDMILLTGDYMTCDDDEQVAPALAILAELPPAPLGRYAVLGNHDYGSAWRQERVAGRLADGLERLGIHTLRNEVVDLAGLQIAGVDDYWGSYFRPEAALAQLDFTRPAIALCHNPDGVDHAAWTSFRGWVLAGHTHGGQCKPPLLPPPLLPVSNRRYVAGVDELAPGRRLYINRGLGYLRRVRFNCRPEITLFTLMREDATDVA